MGYNTQRPFIEILSELEREGIIETHKWIALKKARNALSHEYPYQEESLIEAINFLIENSNYLIEVTDRLKRLFNEIISKRS
jgi:predicted transcriptional regulator